MSLFTEDASLQIVVRLKDEASKALSGVEGKLREFEKRLEGPAAASRSFALALGGAGAALVTLGGFAIKAAAGMEQTKIAFETMLGSAEKADTFIRDMVQFAKTTPFELRGLEDSAKKLLAFGFAQEEVIPNLKTLGNIAAGVGTDKLPELILAFGQVKAATKLTGMELRQFTEAGVPLLDMLSKQMGESVATIQEMVSEGEIGFPQVQKALEALTGEGGRFNNLMEKQSQSLGGMWSNLKDAWDIFLRNEGQQFLEWGKQVVALIIDLIQNHLPKWIDKIEEMVKWFGEHKTAIYVVAGAIVGALVPAIFAAVAALFALGLSLAPFIIGGAVVGAVVAGIMWITQHWGEMAATAHAMWMQVQATIAEVLPNIKKIWTAVWNEIKAVFLGVWDAIKTKVNDVIQFIETQIEKVIALYNKMKQLVSQPISLVTGAVSSLESAMTKGATSLIKKEHGGIVPGPEGMPVPIIAHGQEEVIPASKRGSGSGDFYVTINNPMVRSDDDIDRLTSQVERVFRGLMINHKFTT